MPNPLLGQSGQNVSMAYKEETVTGQVPAVLTGAKRFRLSAGAGLARPVGLIEDPEIRSDGMSSMPRHGLVSVTGSIGGALRVGEFAEAIQAVLRGTAAAGKVVNGVPPVNRSFTIVQEMQDADFSEVFMGCRFSSMTVRLTPDGVITVELGVVGLDMELRQGMASPVFTSPVATTAIALVAVDAALLVDGVPTLDFTAAEFTWDLRAAGVGVIGSRLSPEIWPNNGTLRGSITTIRRNATLQAAYLAEAEFALAINAAEPAPGTGTAAFTLPRCKWIDFRGALGQTGPALATLPFAGAKAETGTDQVMVVYEEAA